MSVSPCSLLSIAPYRFLPPANGGHLGIALMHEHLGRLCEDHVAGTTDNGSDDGWRFTLHRIFPANPLRYLPLRYKNALTNLGKGYDTTAIWCEHPYMAITAAAVAKALGKPWFLRSHNLESDRFRAMGKPWWPVLAFYERWACRNASGIFFVTAEDRDRARHMWKLAEDHCHVAPYGTPLEAVPLPVPDAKAKMAGQFGINPDVPWLYFLGALDYGPNAEALQYIAMEIAPRLRSAGLDCEILIAGKGLLPQDAELLTANNIHYTGFVPDLDAFLQACDVMLNPVISGGGIKTKAVEALAWGKRVVSCYSGAAGLAREACGKALTVLPDWDWDGFCKGIINACSSDATVPDAFFQTYNWDAIAAGVLREIGNCEPRR